MRRWSVLIVSLALGALGASLPEPRSISDRLFARLEDSRKSSGAPDWERRPELDRVAAAAAEEVAVSASRGLDRPIEAFIAAAGIGRVARAVPVVEVLRGYDDPVSAALNHWAHYRQVWEELVGPEIDAIGLAETRAPDGSIVLVAVLVEDRPVPELPLLELQASKLVNEARAGHDLDPLPLSSELSEIARRHSEDMAARDYFSHRSPEGTDVATRALTAGLVFAMIGENISMVSGAEDPASIVVGGWMTSAGHRDNILSKEFEETGMGVAESEDGVLYFTQVFARGAHRAGP